MLLLSTLSAIVAVASSVSGLNIPKSSASGRLIEKVHGPPPGWAIDDSTPINKESSMMKLRVQLVPQNVDKFHEMAINIATPGHASYGTHLSQNVIDAMVAPRDESSDLVMQWIESEGLRQYATLSPRQDSVIVEASISKIERLLNAEYTPFAESSTGDVLVRTLEYSIPEVLQGHVKMIQPTTFFGLRAMKSTILKVKPLDKNKANVDAAAAGCNGGVTPSCLQTLYNFGSATNITAGKIGIAGFLEEWPSASDLATFMNAYAVQDNAAQSYTCELINGGTCPANGGSSTGVEANLDVQYVRAITESIPNVYYSTGGRPPIVGGGANTNEPYLEFLNYVLALDDADLPNTISISYGEDEETIPLDYADTTCDLFSQLGARGVSILVSSGDSGVGDTCTSGGQTTFTSAFPAACPWVTTVGGTSGSGPEAAWTHGGGGFSNRFGRPSYQDAAVNSWLTNDKTHAAVTKYFNSSGRAYPDVSAQATNFAIVVDGRTVGVDGTSCSSPTFAGVIQLINSNRVAAGKAGLGFLNPWLYSSASSALTDIAKGGITGCQGVISNAGFQAVAGWDPATGLGTPNYAKLLAVSNST